MQLPEDVLVCVLQISNALPVGRQLNWQFHSALLKRCRIDAGDPHLPLWLLQQMWKTGTSKEQQPRLLKARALAGDVAGVLWLSSQGCPCADTSSILRHAAKTGSLPLLEWCRSLPDSAQGWHAGTCAAAARHGRLEALQWLRAQTPPCPWDSGCFTAAAEAGHMHVLKWLADQDPPAPWDADACSFAAARGRLDVLVWLRAQSPPCPWDAWTTRTAAGAGQLAVLRWLREQGCPLDAAWTNLAAAFNGHTAVLEWLQAVQAAQAQQPQQVQAA